MRFYLLLMAMFLCTAGLTWAFQHPVTETAKFKPGIPACEVSHHQIVMVPIFTGKAEMDEAPIVAEVCDKVTLDSRSR